MVAALSVSTTRSRAGDNENAAKPTRAETPRLQLTVDVPPRWRPFLSDDLAEAFASRLADVFRRHGYPPAIRFIEHENPATDVPVLAIRLIDWRISHPHQAECTFSAALKNDDGEHALGIFENTRREWSHRFGHGDPADALGEVADGALRDLSAKLDQSGLLPGFSATRI